MQNKLNDNHNSGIDVLRGIAILSVILLHINIRLPFSDTFLGSLMPKSIYNIMFWSGYYGVCIFFVISGFLITTSALNKWNSLQNISLRGFYFMRFARIMPLLIALLLILSMLHLSGMKEFIINPETTTLGKSIFAALTFQINLLEINVGYLPGSWDILWSLSIEEIFYLFFPIICIVCRKEWNFIAIVAFFLIISPFARTVWYPGNELGDRNYFAYFDAISIGCMAAIIARRIEIKKRSLTIISVVGWVLFLFVTLFRKWANLMGLPYTGLNVTLLAVGSGLVLIGMQKQFVSGLQIPSKFTGFLRFLGRNSYEVYLTHMFVVFSFVAGYKAMNLSGEWAWILYVSIVITSGILGYITAQYFSNPINIMLREKFQGRKEKKYKLDYRIR